MDEPSLFDLADEIQSHSDQLGVEITGFACDHAMMRYSILVTLATGHQEVVQSPADWADKVEDICLANDAWEKWRQRHRPPPATVRMLDNR